MERHPTLGSRSRGHAVRATSGVVDIAHERIGGHRDMNTAFDGGPVGREGSIPQPGEAENLAVGKMNEERLLAAVSSKMPFIESRGNLDTALPALPRSPVRGCGLDGLYTRINGRVLRRYALGEERYQSPAQHYAFSLAFGAANHGDLLRRRDVVARFETPPRLHN